MIPQVQHPLAFHAAPSTHSEKRQKFIWDRKREAIFISACLALIYLNGGKIELRKERVTNSKQKSIMFPQAIEHILQRGNFSEFKTLPKKAVQSHIGLLRAKSKKRGSDLEEELLKQYQNLEAKTVVNGIEEEGPTLLAELNKFGIKAEEYNQGVPIESWFIWDEEREEIFISACIALIYLNGGNVELKKGRETNGKKKNILFPGAIEYILQRGNFSEFKTLPKKAVGGHINYLRQKNMERGSTLEEELLKQYQDLKGKIIVNDKGENTSLLLEKLNKFGIKPDDYDSWIVIQSKTSSKRRNPRKRPAEEPADPEAEPQEKRANNALEKPPQGNQVTHWKKRLINDWKQIK